MVCHALYHYKNSFLRLFGDLITRWKNAHRCFYCIATKEQALRENERRRRGDVTGWTPKKKRIERTECGCCCCAFGWPVCLPTWSDLGRYLALIFILLPPTLLICLLCLIPWSIDCLRFTRPVMPVADDDVGRPGHISEEDVEDAEDPEHPYGRYRGFNPDIGHVPMGFLLPWSHSKSESLWLRAWYMYLCFRMIFQMIAAQALQICSVLSALVIIICQILMIAHDMSSKLVGGRTCLIPHYLAEVGVCLLIIIPNSSSLLMWTPSQVGTTAGRNKSWTVVLPIVLTLLGLG